MSVTVKMALSTCKFHRLVFCTSFMLGMQGMHRLEKYLKIKSALNSTGKSLKCLEKSLNYSIFCRT